MCLDPKVRFTPSKRLNFNNQSAWIHYKCGKCAECKAEYKDEWLVRIYSQYEYYRKLGGFTFFETLTYDEEHCPTFHGMRCFDPEHIKKFRQNLRNKITRYNEAFKNAYENNFSLIIASEYGGSTHRPHYHALFFCSIPGLNFMLLRQFIEECWTYGRIDSLVTAQSRVVNAMGALGYVSKYLCKDDEWSLKIEERLDEARRSMPPLQFERIYNKKALDMIKPFHRQSKKFGASALIPGVLMANPKEYILDHGTINIPDGENGVKAVKVPMYLQRQPGMFYQQIKDEVLLDKDGKPLLRWVQTDLGKKYAQNQLNNIIQRTIEKHENLVSNLSSYLSDENCDNNQRYVYYQQKIHSLLNGRSIKDYCLYKSVYQGRLFDFKHNPLPDPYEFFVEDKHNDDFSVIIEKPSNHLISEPFVTIRHHGFLSSLLSDEVTRYKCVNPDNDVIYLSNILNDLQINQFSYKEFENFDELEKVFNEITNLVNANKFRFYRNKQAIRSKLKCITEPWLISYSRINANSLFTTL